MTLSVAAAFINEAVDEVLAFANQYIANDSEDICVQIGSCCTAALEDEVVTSPKPGLVDRMNSGAHIDMDYSTFMKSIRAISPFFSIFAKAGSNFEFIGPTTLEKIRPLGVNCEEEMFRATEGINTHKGAIFSLGILATAAGYCYRSYHCLSADVICEMAAVIAAGAARDFERDSYSRTKGLKIFTAYGVRGVRGEAGSGFYSVRKYGLPLMKRLFFQQNFHKNEVYLQVLLNLIAHVTDTNVIARCGIEKVNWTQNQAKKALREGGALAADGRKRLAELDRKFTENNVSPGGCADLLSVTIFLYMLDSFKKPACLPSF